MQVYRSVLIETPSLPIAPGRYIVSGLDPETSYSVQCNWQEQTTSLYLCRYYTGYVNVWNKIDVLITTYMSVWNFVERQVIVNKH